MAWLPNNILYGPTVFNRSNNRGCGNIDREVKENNSFRSINASKLGMWLSTNFLLAL